jgi:hypothetical protein
MNLRVIGVITGMMAFLNWGMAIRNILWLCLGIGTYWIGPVNNLCDDNVDFRSQILPLLQKHCLDCHSASRSEGALRLDDEALA